MHDNQRRSSVELSPTLTENPRNEKLSDMKRLKQDKLTGPNGETVKVNWMPDGRLRLDFIDCGTCAVTKIFPDPKGQTHVEIKYGD